MAKSSTIHDQQQQQQKNYTVTTRIFRTKRLNNLCIFMFLLLLLLFLFICNFGSTTTDEQQQQNYTVTTWIMRTKRLNNLCRLIFLLLLLLCNFVLVHVLLRIQNDRWTPHRGIWWLRAVLYYVSFSFAHFMFSCCRGKSYIWMNRAYKLLNTEQFMYIPVLYLLLLLLLFHIIVLQLYLWIHSYSWTTTTTTKLHSNKKNNQKKRIEQFI